MGIINRSTRSFARRLTIGMTGVVATVLAGTASFAQVPCACGPAIASAYGMANPVSVSGGSPGFAGQGFPKLDSYSTAGPLLSSPPVPYCGSRNAYMFSQVPPAGGLAAWDTPPCGVYSPSGSPLPAAGVNDSVNCRSAYSDFGNCNLADVNAANWGCGSIPVNSFYGGFEFLWMRAHFDQNVAMIIDPPVGNTLVPFDYDFKFTPRTWLGWQAADGGGFRATYWRFSDQAATERATAVAGATPVYLFVYGAGGNLTRNAYADLGETLVSNHSLAMQALDLEATQRFGLGQLQCLLGAGVRLADMDQHLRGEVYDASNALWEVVTNDLSFQGAGPTASLQATRALGASRFSTFGGLRGALLYSETQQAIYEMKDGYANELTDMAKATEMLSMGEMSIGLQYTQHIGPRAQFFVRGSYEGQAWFDVGGPVDSHSTVALDGIGLATGLLF